MTASVGIDGVLVGQSTDRTGGTGCTVILAPKGATVSMDARGGAPSTRETELLSPHSTVNRIHGILLAGGSSFGLAAADGVVAFLEEQGYGHETLYGRVPLVTGAVIYDLGVADPRARPSADDGYRAAAGAASLVEEGSVGAGTGATVGKILFREGWMKGGLGVASLELPGGVTVTALTVVNAFGDILAEDGSVLAGARLGGGFLDTSRHLLALEDHLHFSRSPTPGLTSTTLAVILTNARLDRIQCSFVAQQAHDGLARSISPVHTPVDGDTVFVLSAGAEASNVFQLGTAAALVTAASIRRAVRVAEGLAGVPALRGLA